MLFKQNTDLIEIIRKIVDALTVCIFFSVIPQFILLSNYTRGSESWILYVLVIIGTAFSGIIFNLIGMSIAQVMEDIRAIRVATCNDEDMNYSKIIQKL